MNDKLIDISKLCEELELINKKTGKPSSHIIRFWEKQFRQIKPLILKGNRRYYDKSQVKKVRYIKYLLKDKGLTIKGAKKMLNKKNIDGDTINNVEKDYYKTLIKNRSKTILKKIKRLKDYG